MKQQTTMPKIHHTPSQLDRFYLDEEQQILLALAQITVVDGLLYAVATHEKDSPLDLEGMASAACHLTRASLDAFKRLDIGELVVNARGEEPRRQG